MTKLLRNLCASVLLAGALTGCGIFASEIAETPAQRVFALKSDYQAILILAVKYESLPRCPDVDTLVCSEPAVVDIIRSADNRATLALDGAEEVVRSEAASEQTVNLAIEAAKKALDVLRQILIEEEILVYVPATVPQIHALYYGGSASL